MFKKPKGWMAPKMRIIGIIGALFYPVTAAIAVWNNLIVAAPRLGIIYLSGTAVFVVSFVFLRDQTHLSEQLPMASVPLVAYTLGLMVVLGLTWLWPSRKPSQHR